MGYIEKKSSVCCIWTTWRRHTFDVLDATLPEAY